MYQFNELKELIKEIEINKDNGKYMRKDGKSIFWFPIKANAHKPYVLDALEDLYAKYINLLKDEKYKEKLPLIDSEINTIKENCKNIISILKKNLDGDVFGAYKEFKSMMDKCILNFPHKEVESDKSFFRMRKETGLTEKKDFYHLPINLRRKRCSSERFSIAGYPCFYIGYSKKDCINEIYKTDTSPKGSIIELKLNEGESIDKVLDLTFFEGQKKQTQLKEFLLAFPVIASCYVVIEGDDNVAFHEEYIIPQMLTSYLKNTNNKFKGICYYSVRSENSPTLPTDSDEDCRNLVLFTSFEGSNEYDMNLMGKFEWGIPSNV